MMCILMLVSCTLKFICIQTEQRQCQKKAESNHNSLSQLVFHYVTRVDYRAPGTHFISMNATH